MTQRPLRRRLAILLVKVARWLHIYASMLGLATVLFFSATGITLNHPDWFFGDAQKTTQAEGDLDMAWLRAEAPAEGSNAGTSEEAIPADPTDQVKRLEVVEALRKQHGIGGALTDFRVDDSEIVVAFKGPGYSADAFIDRESGRYTLSQTFHGAVAVLNDLHKGRDTGPVWSVFIDVSAVLLVFISLTGLILIFYLKLRRVPGLAIAVLGTLAVIVFYYWGVP